MKSLRSLCLVSVLGLVSLLAVPSRSHAQAEQGDKEVLFFANIQSSHSPGSTTTIGTVYANLGYFVTDTMEVGGGPLFTIASVGGTSVEIGGVDFEVDGGGTSATTGINAFFRYYLGDTLATLKPYVGAEYSVTDFGNAGESQFIGGTGGLKNYFSENTALDVKASYGFRPSAPGDYQLLSIAVGITYTF